MEINEKKCPCGEYFAPLLASQKHCVKCINRRAKKGLYADIETLKGIGFAEWFIFRWQMIQRAAEKKYGVSVVQEAAKKRPERTPSRGKWFITDASPHWVCCSECYARLVPDSGWIGRYNIPTNFCPKCGAEMEGVSNG